MIPALVVSPALIVCPYCKEKVMVEYDPVMRRGFCNACGRIFPLSRGPERSV